MLPAFSRGVFTLFCGLAVAAGADEPAAAPAAKPFVSLYNGHDLSGWSVRGGRADSWKADGELITCVGAEGGWLQTEKVFSDFVLKLDYRIPAGGNSGVGIRVPPEGNPAHAGMEIQILDDDAPEYKDLKASQFNGSIYGQVAAKRGAGKPAGEWNRYEITCRGPIVKVVLNGETIVDVEVDTKKEGQEGQPALADRPEIGCLALQSHGARVDFRNIALLDLVTTTDSGLKYTDVVEGTGATVPAGGMVTVHFTGRFPDGRKFDSSRDRGAPESFLVPNLIRGWREGLAGMKVSGRRKLMIPPELGYGAAGFRDKIPPGATLIFDVEVLDVN